jgi:N-acetylglucosamine-6-phosphate deacetylase
MADRLLVFNARLLFQDQILPGYSLLCEDGIIRELAPDGKIQTGARHLDAGARGFDAGAQRFDAGGRYLTPGYIDMHIHGFKGRLVDRGPADLEALCRELPARGVTAFLPTVTPQPEERRLLSELASVRPRGARILGFFLEGHFLALTGAIRGLNRDYSAARAAGLREALGNTPAIFGISPEIPGICSLLPLMTQGGRPAFITHTGAGFEETERAIDAGARHATHFYDVFPYPGEQEPGVRGCGAVEAILARPEVTVDFILDGEHAHPGAVRMALACKGPDAVCLVTDANINAGLPPGTYEGISGAGIVMKYPGGPARDRETGGLTGSGLTLDLAVKNAVKLLGLSLPQAVYLASANPAKVLGLENQTGKIETGLWADFLLLDEDLNVTECFIGGKQWISESAKNQ